MVDAAYYGTFSNGNYTFDDNLSIGAKLYVKNEEEYLWRVLRAPIKFKDLVDRNSTENITGAWNFTNGATLIADTPASQVGASDWKLISWQNFTSTRAGINVSKFTNANWHRMDFMIWNEDLRCDNDGIGGGSQGGMPLWRFIGNRFLTFLENTVLDMNLSEFHSGYRLYKVNALKKIPFIKCSNNYYFDSEILMQMRIADMKIKEVEIPTHYAKDSQSPTVMQTFQYSKAIILMLMRYLFHKYRIKSYEVFENH